MDVPPSNTLLYFDDLLRQIGGTGVYQIIFFIITFMLGMFSVETIYITFIAVAMPHWCKVKELENLPFEVQKNVAIPSDNRNDWTSTGAFSQCQMFNFNYSAYTTEDFLSWNRTLQAAGNTPVSCTDGWTYDKSQFASSGVAEYNLVCGRAWLVPLLSTAYTGGMFLGAISAGFFSDKFGRRPVMVVYYFIKLAGGIFSAFAPNYGSMLAARLIIGFGSTGVYLIVFVLIVEVSVGKARTIFGTGLMIAFAFGYMLIPAVALVVRDFRKISIVMAGPSIICVFLWWIVPESPRWLLIKGKLKEADKSIRFIASVNNCPLPDDFDISHIRMDDGRSADLPKRNILDLFKRRRICIWTLIVYLHWFTDSLVYYAMSLNAGNLAGSIFLNTFLLGLVEIPANVLLTFTLQWRPMGRRISSSVALLVAGGTSLICIPLVVTGASPAATTALSLIGKAGSTMGFSAAYVYTGEIFPTEVRNVAMGSASTVARISGMGAPFVGGILGKVWKGLPYLIYGVFGIVSGLLTLYLPETLGRPLCETLDEAEALGNSKQAVAPEPATYPAGSFSQIEASAGITHRKPSTFAAHVNPAFSDEIK